MGHHAHLLPAAIGLVAHLAVPPVRALEAPPGPRPAGDTIAAMETYVSRDLVRPGEAFKAAVRLIIAPGWHINANPAGDELLVPTTLELSGPNPSFPLTAIQYPEAFPVRLSFSEKEVAVYSGSALILLDLEADPGLLPGLHELMATVTWQACNDVSCLPPESGEVSIEIAVAAAGTKTKAAHLEIFGQGPEPGRSPERLRK